MLCCLFLIVIVPKSIRYTCFMSGLLVMIAYMLKIYQNKKYRIPLKITKRILRIMILHESMLFLIVLLYLKMEITLQIYGCPLLYIISYYWLIVTLWVLNPLEKKIKNDYKQKAKLKINKNSKVIAIGGSYGKTSIKNIAYELIKPSYYTMKTSYSYNNEMGISKYLLEQYDPHAEVFICEVGVDHVNEMDELLKLVDADFVLLSAIGNQHLESFKTYENIKREKQKLIQDINKVRIANIDDVTLDGIKDKHQVITYGFHKSDYQIMDLNYENKLMKFQIKYKDQIYDFETSLLGKHHVQNITGAIVLARSLNITWEQLRIRVKNLKQIDHRLALRKVDDYYLLDDAYNANEKGLRCACDVLKMMEGKKIIICSGLVEVLDGNKIHYEIGQYMADCCDEVILIGQYQDAMKEGLLSNNYTLEHIYCVKDINEAFKQLQIIKETNCVVLIENDLQDVYC